MDQDIKLWQQWQQNPNKDNTKALLDQTAGIRHRSIQSWSGSLSPVTLQSEAVKQSLNAFKSFDPSKDVKLTTHLTNNLKKLSRDAYAEVSFLRMPEDRQMKYRSFETAREDLKERLGRSPSDFELADELSWSLPEVRRFLSEDKKILVDSEPLPIGLQSFSLTGGLDPNDRLHFVVADMNDVDKQIFAHTTGYEGAKILTGADLMRKLNLTQSQLSYRKRVIADQVKAFRR
jgi:hypothetical protein